MQAPEILDECPTLEAAAQAISAALAAADHSRGRWRCAVTGTDIVLQVKIPARGKATLTMQRDDAAPTHAELNRAGVAFGRSPAPEIWSRAHVWDDQRGRYVRTATAIIY